MTFLEIRPGLWVVPDLVTTVEGRAGYNGMRYDRWIVEVTMIGGAKAIIRGEEYPLGDPPHFGPGEDGLDQQGREEAERLCEFIDRHRSKDPTIVVVHADG